ncbi:hypothetical protein [Cellulomonas sp. Leaf395]|uniref:hypothetical protein n=1 Tax=Cellulomonas sp. Leaf395 TaxID=1736362 RepID=UPI00191053AC|nr:hypothetical protein [Cellulomonas sp. Leaf395]
MTRFASSRTEAAENLKKENERLFRVTKLSKVGDVMKKLNLKDVAVRAGIMAGTQTVDWFYNSDLAINYYAEETVEADVPLECH